MINKNQYENGTGLEGRENIKVKILAGVHNRVFLLLHLG
jgi:hypothetical protein